MLAGESSLGALGVRVSLSEQLGFASFGTVHLLTLNFALVGTAGPAR